MTKYQNYLFSFVVLFLLFFPQTTWAENQPGSENCWDDFYEPPAAKTQIVRIDHLGIEVTIPSNYEIPLNRKYGNIIIIGSDRARTWLMLADNGV